MLQIFGEVLSIVTGRSAPIGKVQSVAAAEQEARRVVTWRRPHGTPRLG